MRCRSVGISASNVLCWKIHADISKLDHSNSNSAFQLYHSPNQRHFLSSFTKARPKGAISREIIKLIFGWFCRVIEGGQKSKYTSLSLLSHCRTYESPSELFEFSNRYGNWKDGEYLVPSHQGLFHFFRSPNSFSYSFLHFKICTACISSARPGHALDFNCQLTPFQGVWDESGSIMGKWQIRSLHSGLFFIKHWSKLLM